MLRYVLGIQHIRTSYFQALITSVVLRLSLMAQLIWFFLQPGYYSSIEEAAFKLSELSSTIGGVLMLPKVFRIGLLALLVFMLCFFVIPGVGLFMSAFYVFIGLFVLITCFAVFGPIVIVALSYFCTTHRLEATVQQVFHRKSSLDTGKTIRFVRIVFAGTNRSMNWRSESLKLGESITILKRGWVFILKHDDVCRTQIVF